jgi:hypothetical protein
VLIQLLFGGAKGDVMMNIERLYAGEGDEDARAEGMSDFFFGPAQVDQTVRMALQHCWMAVPKASRTTEEVERHFRRIVERALKDLREDCEAFGFPK